MLTSTKMFLMMSQEVDYGALVRGADAASAIERHYAEMDAWCPPQDPELNEEFAVTLYEIPRHAEGEVAALVDKLSAGDYTAAAAHLVARYPDITSTIVNVIYTYAEGAKATELKPMPDLFERLR
ncbi:hypothetical protein NKJ26_26590 [Mesorhizobium sp. M0152]|uniref:hypothetical protein n=2 Tax=Mesorhizobium TaxID=68287 RepID=UPI0033372D61